MTDPQQPWKIYGLLDPRDQRVRYVGVVISSRNRLKRHIGEARRGGKTHKCNWIRSLLTENLLPIELSLETGFGESWRIAECQWIAHFGENLTNSTKGGLGSIGFKHTPEAKLKISLAKRNPSLETRIRLGNGNRGRKDSPEAIERRIAPIRGRKQTREHILARAISKRKFSAIEINAIRRRFSEGTSQVCLSKVYGVSQAMIGNIVRGISYKDIPTL
jgi:hypothetical protein